VCILFFATEILPAPFELEGGVVIGEAGYIAVTEPVAWSSTCGSGAAFELSVVLPESSVFVDGGSYVGGSF